MNPYIEIIRPTVCGLAVLGIMIGALVAGTLAAFPAILLAIIAAFLICASGDVINDYVDIEIDKINKPERPLPSGRISKKAALYYFWILGIVGIIASWFVSLPFFGLALFNFVVSSGYTWKLKPIPGLKNVAVAWLGASSFLAGGLIAGISIPLLLLLLVAISFVVTLGREIIMDIGDMEGDRKAGIRTLPIRFGIKGPKIFAYLLIFLGCILLLAPFALGPFKPAYWIGAVPAVLLCIYSAKLQPRKSRKAIKAAMYLVFLAFILGSLPL
jgi:geranylgeranylglycerol-phosphate geranylgeranyltransferase